MLLILVVGLRSLLVPGQQLLATLTGYRFCDNPQPIIPFDISTTTARSDIVLV